MEIRDLLDKNRKFTGKTLKKGESIPKDRYIGIIIIMIENNTNEFLIQKRSKQKDGKWGSTGGHLLTGEDSTDGILREVREEIGVTLSEDEIELIFSKKTDDTFVDLYYTKKEINIQNLTLQEEEVEAVKLASISEIEEMVKQNIFLKTHYDCLKQYLYFREETASYLQRKSKL